MTDNEKISFFREIILSHKGLIRLHFGSVPYFSTCIVEELLNEFQLRLLEVKEKGEDMTTTDIVMFELLKQSLELNRYLPYKREQENDSLLRV